MDIVFSINDEQAEMLRILFDIEHSLAKLARELREINNTFKPRSSILSPYPFDDRVKSMLEKIKTKEINEHNLSEKIKEIWK